MRAPVRALLVSAALAVLLHAALLGEWTPGFSDDTPPPEPMPLAEPLRVRALPSPVALERPPSPPASPRETPAAQAAAAVRPPAARRQQPASAADPQAAAVPPAAPVDTRPMPSLPTATPATPSPPASAAGVAQVAPAASASASGERLPVYVTRLPPPVTLRYGAQGGRIAGSAELVWRPDGGRYQASLTMSVMGFTALTWRSQGQLDEHGIAPERFTDLRRRRAEQAANFRRDTGRITFSGPSTEYPLHPGTQDRLSWLIQVPGVIAAAPQHFVAGSEIRLFVAGARGDADVWVLHVHGAERVTLPDGREIAALRLSREPHTPYGTEAEIWLDPTRHHLPVRVRIGDQTLELLEGLPPP